MDAPASSPKAAAGKGLSTLKRLPPWAWVLVAGGVLMVAMYLKHRRDQAAQDAATAAGPDPMNAGADPTYGTDPGLAGSWTSGQDFSLPNGAGAPSVPGDSGGGITYTGATTTDSHDVNDSHDSNITYSTSVGDTTYSPSNTFGDINSPFATTTVTSGGGPPVRPPSHGAPAAKPPPRLKPGWLRAPSGPRRPPNKRGYVVVGLGSGNWAYRPVGRR